MCFLRINASMQRYFITFICANVIFLRFYMLIQVKSKNKTLERADLTSCFDLSKNRNSCHSLKYRMFTLTLFKEKERFSVCF